MIKKFQYLQHLLEKKYEQNRFKQLRYFTKQSNTEESSDFQTHDALHLQAHPFVKKNSIKYILEFGMGSKSSSSYLTQLNLQQKIEEKLKLLTGYEESFLLMNDQHIHQYLLKFLTQTKSVIFVDKGSSTTLIKAALETNAKVFFYEHNRCEHLEDLLNKHDNLIGCTKVIVSESLFFDSGDLCYLKALTTLSKKYEAILYIDDSSSYGIMGENGLGFCSHKKDIDIVVSSFGKSFSSFGYFVLCNTLIKEAMLELSGELNSVRLLSPACLGAIDAELDLLPDMDLERNKLQKNAQYLRRLLKEKGFDLGNCSSHIIPLYFDTKEEIKDLYEHLATNKILVSYASQDRKNPLIKILVHANHTKEELDHLVGGIFSWEKPLAYKTL